MQTMQAITFATRPCVRAHAAGNTASILCSLHTAASASCAIAMHAWMTEHAVAQASKSTSVTNGQQQEQPNSCINYTSLHCRTGTRNGVCTSPCSHSMCHCHMQRTQLQHKHTHCFSTTMTTHLICPFLSCRPHQKLTASRGWPRKSLQ